LNKKTLNMIGIAKRAGRAVSGAYQVEDAVRRRQARLVIVAEDASDNTRKHISDMCRYRKIPWAAAGEKAVLGKAVGQEERTCLAVTDAGLAEAVIRLMGEEGITLEREGE
jgi:ribosomal protein L7Ae-like RNA K-turn-binding protein